MDTPAKYEDLVLKVAELERREAVLEGLLKESLVSVAFDLEKVEGREAETYLIALITRIKAELNGAKS